MDAFPPDGGVAPVVCCASPAGASPVPVGIGAPGSRPQPSGGDSDGQAGCRKPATRRKPCNGKRARGPQHQVNLAASTEEQSGGRAGHVAAKATPAARGPKRAGGSGGVRRAARVQGEVRNSGDPSAPPWSRQGSSYKPKAKSSAAQRESEGTVVPQTGAQALGTNAVKNNAAGGRGPCFGHVQEEGKCEGMAAKSGPNDPAGLWPCDEARRPSSGLWASAERVGALAVRLGKPRRSDARRAGRLTGTPTAHASSRRPSVSRVPEIGMHGLNGGSAFLPMTTRRREGG